MRIKPRISCHQWKARCQRKCTVEPEKEIDGGACHSMKEEVVVYIHHGTALLPILPPALLPVPLF